MKLGIMQPYFIPYIGYWQLINAVDKYVIYDDVNFIKGGWINRNKILLNGEAHYFNVPMIGASSFKKINEVSVNWDKKLMENNIKTISNAYRNAPYYEIVFPIVEKILRFQTSSLSDYVINSIRIICEYLQIGTELILSSEIDKDENLKGQDKVVSICHLLGATEYVNAIGGQELYSKEMFLNEGIQLSFLHSNTIIYNQRNTEFVPNLSIIDVMMFNCKEKIEDYLKEFELV